MESMLEQQEQWMEQNPLRRYRKANGVSYMNTARILGVTIAAVQKWENGTSQPTPENMAKIAVFCQDPNLAEKWEEWLSRRPQIA
jgi:DNA-binding transcriptional regulator YiaG